MARLLATADGLTVLILGDDGNIYRRRAKNNDVLALDTGKIGVAGDPSGFNWRSYADNINRWGLWRVVGADGEFYPEAKAGLPRLIFTWLHGEPVFKVRT